jgi:hypothetical protein
MIRVFLASCLLALTGLATAHAQPFVLIETEQVIVCPAVAGMSSPPDFTAPECESQNFWDVDPQGRHIWIRAELELTEAQHAARGPLAIFIWGKAASEVYVNGTRIGANGVPGATAEAEIPGLMDAALYVRQETLRVGTNEIIAELSGMHGFLTLRGPMHMLGLGRYAPPTDFIIQAYWPSLITFGAFALGFLFFGLTAIRGEDREGSLILCLISLFAGAQLLTEAGRGIIAYAYPMQDVRLVAILTLSVCFSLALVAHLLHRYSGLGLGQRLLRLAGVLAAISVSIALSQGFDAKAGFSILVAASLGAIWCGVWSVQRKPGAPIYLVLLIALCALMLFFQGDFLDIYFFYSVTVLLLFMFSQQAMALIRERRNRRAEETRAGKLEAALDLARQQTAPAQLQLVSAGRVEYVSTENIAQLKGAGDYVEVHFESGKTSLYNGSLAGLEDDLPPTFLRVHRSHIVNTAFVRALERDASGVGRLILANGMDIPVSRRIMPKVRHALAAAAE